MNWRVWLIAIFGLGLVPNAIPAGALDSSICVQKQGPVGANFPDCTGGQVYNIVPPGQTGLYTAADFAALHANGTLAAHTAEEAPMYANLIKVAPGLQAGDLTKFYKDASFYTDAAQAEKVEKPRAGAVILRDKQFGVPHIYGVTRADTEFGSGYASAEDRLFMMDVLRHYGRGKLTSLLGSGGIGMDCGIDTQAGYAESDPADPYNLQQQVNGFAARYPTPFHVDTSPATTEGQQIVLDGQAYIAGVNQYISDVTANPAIQPVEYAALQIPLTPNWQMSDIIATATLVQAIFAKGGGNEVGSALFYQSLVAKWGQDKGSRMWHDFRSQLDPDRRNSISATFNYEHVPDNVDPNSVAMPLGTPQNTYCNGQPVPTSPSGQISAGGTTIDLSGIVPHSGAPRGSNELIVDAAHSAGGHPIAVFGPQTGYFAPEILHEIDLHGPGLHARGVSFPATEVFVELGHGVDYAWSATSAGSDIVDQRAERLCNPATFPAGPVDPNSTSYVFDNGKGGGPKCIPMYERTDTQLAKTSAASQTPPQLVNIQIERTVHGPVQGRTTAIDPQTGKAVPVAISSQRSTFGDELGSAPTFLEWNDPDITKDAHSFQVAAGKEAGTFNWTYVDANDMAYYQSGLLPQRHPRVNPNFPTWGTGQWEWQGYVPSDLSAADVHARMINQPSGLFTNWNNAGAAGFSAADDNYAYGPTYREQSLNDRVKAVISQKLATPVDIVNAMEDGGSVDLDGAQLVEPLAAVIGSSVSGPEKEVMDLLRVWAADPTWGPGVPGAHRRDRAGTGSYEQGTAVAIMDYLYPRLVHAVFDPALNYTDSFDNTTTGFKRLEGLNGINDAPRAQGSAYDGGWEGYLQRALKQAANPSIANGYASSYCGSGDLTVCQRQLIGALDAAISNLTTTYGSPDPAKWTCARTNDLTGHSAGAGQDTNPADKIKCNPALDDIQFSAVGVGSVPGMPWVNRPTFQQVVQFPGHAARPITVSNQGTPNTASQRQMSMWLLLLAALALFGLSFSRLARVRRSARA